jgi:hypothetical protein
MNNHHNNISSWNILFFSGGKRFLCSNPGNELTLYHWKKGFTQNARSGTRVFKTRVLNAQTYRMNMLRSQLLPNLHQFAYLKLVGLTFSLLGLGNPNFWDSQQRFRARLLWLLPLLQDLANHIPEGLDNLIKSHHVAVYCLALHHKIWIWSFIRSYHMYVYIYIISCHVISYEIQSYHIISYHILYI